MANKYIGIRNGNKINEQGFLLEFINALAGGQNSGKVESTAYQVNQASPTANMSVDIQPGHYFIPYLSYGFPTWSTVVQNLAIAAADPSNHRWSRIIAYVDLSVADTVNANTPDGIKYMEVAGTPSGSPVVPSDSAVQSAVGASNPWQEIGRIDVPPAVIQILTANITDKRTLFNIGGGNGGAQLGLVGTLNVGTDMTPNWVAAKPGTFTTVTARVKTPSVGQDIILQLNKNGVLVTTITITAGSNTATPVAINLSVVPNDYLSVDINQVGSTTNGSNATVSIA